MTTKLLIATGVYPPQSGGPATYTKLLEEKLPPLGFEVQAAPFLIVKNLPKIVRHVAYLWCCVRLGAKADIIYAQDTVSVGFPAALASMVLRKKFVVRVPGDYAWEQAVQRFGVTDSLDVFQKKSYGLRVALLRKVQNFTVRHADAVIVPSLYLQGIVKKWGVEPTLQYNGIDLSIEYTLPQRPEGFLIVSFGRDVPWKGFEALRAVVAREPEWHLKIFHDMPRKEAMGWLKAADVYVNNSLYEGLSHQLLEAMALGTPIVATRVGGNPELVGEDRGLLIAPQDSEALQRALADVASNRGAARARAERARNFVEEFALSRTLPKLAVFFKSL